MAVEEDGLSVSQAVAEATAEGRRPRTENGSHGDNGMMTGMA